jgi:multidrug efflux pump
VLTLFTTPVVYLFFDRLGRRYRHADAELHAHAVSAD